MFCYMVYTIASAIFARLVQCPTRKLTLATGPEISKSVFGSNVLPNVMIRK